MKPILKIMKEDFKKDVEQGVLLQGLTDLFNSNTENMEKMISSTASLMTTKNEASPSPSNETSPSPSKITKLTKLARVPSWTKDMSLETYINS